MSSRTSAWVTNQLNRDAVGCEPVRAQTDRIAPVPARSRLGLLQVSIAVRPIVRSTTTTSHRFQSRRHMSTPRILRFVVVASAMLALAACSAGGSGERGAAAPLSGAAAAAGDPITGEGLPN